MSILDHGNELVRIYPEIETTDEDGNIITKPSDTAIEVKVLLQVQPASGTSARRAEQDNEGFESEMNYRMRMPRSFKQILGAQSRVEWKGQYWAINGDAQIYNGSRRTAHVDYTIRRT